MGCKLTRYKLLLTLWDMTAPFMRRVAWIPEPGGPEVIEIRRDAVAPPSGADVLVRVEAVGLNHVENLVRSGRYAVSRSFPCPAGIEGAGVVVASGPEAGLDPGTRVAWTAGFGCCATMAVLPASILAPLPDGLAFEEGASLAHAALTAAGLIRHCPVPAGAAVLVWAAAGSVGQLLVAQLAARGVRVAGVASGGRTAAVMAAGADRAVDRSREDVSTAVRDWCGGSGVAAVFDPVGADTYRTNLGVLAARGCLVNYGQLSGALPEVALEDLMNAGSVFVTKYGPKARVIAPGDVGKVAADGLRTAAAAALRVPIAARFPLDRAADAYRALDHGPQGKVLVLPHAG
jgi:NADPH2:quinone reductase